MNIVSHCIKTILVIVCCCTILFFVWMKHAYEYLSLSQPVCSPEIIVIEAWAAPYAFKIAADLYHANNAPLVVVCGVVMKPRMEEKLQNISTLNQLGVSPDSVVKLIVVDKQLHRTFTAAKRFLEWLNENNKDTSRILLVTMGAHSRKTYTFYKYVLGEKWRVGIVSVPYGSWSNKGFRYTLRKMKYLTEASIEWIYTWGMTRL